MKKVKPIGPIPEYFSRKAETLSGAPFEVEALVAEHGSPLFVYSAAALDQRMVQLRAAMPKALHIHYAMKANPFAPLLRHMVGLTEGIDIASVGELDQVLAVGAVPEHISFAGPGKRDRELETAIRLGVTINLESPNECERALKIGNSLDKTPRLAVRVNPDFELKGSGMRMGGGAKPFGMDVELVAPVIARIREAGAEWRGFHIFAGSQALDAAAIIEAQQQTLALAGRLADDVKASPPLVNIGGGLGIPYFPGDEPVDVAAIGTALGEALENRPDSLSDSRFAMELGRYLVGEAGVYLTRIVDVKASRGETFYVVDGGLHHQLAASGNFGTVVRRNYPVAIASRWGEPAAGPATIVGCLCTPLDLLCDHAELPEAQVGDVVAIFCAGAYGATASPAEFLGQGPAKQVLIN